MDFLRRLSFTFFVSPFLFLLFLKIGEIRTTVTTKTENLIYGYSLIFIIPFILGILLFTLYMSISEKEKSGYIGLILTLIFSVIYYFVFTDKSSKLDTRNIIVIVIFSLLFSYLIIYIIDLLFIKFKDWIFEKENETSVKDKLSFVNKIILSVATTVASILGVILTLKNLFS
ncbi:hypothetical protein [Staphylococcus caprae]